MHHGAQIIFREGSERSRVDAGGGGAVVAGHGAVTLLTVLDPHSQATELVTLLSTVIGLAVKVTEDMVTLKKTLAKKKFIPEQQIMLG